METTDLSIEILKGIREEGRRTNERLDETNRRLDDTVSRLDETVARLESLRDELSRRIVESELRTATAITELAGTVREMTSFLKQTNDLRPRVERCESDIEALKRRIG